MTHDEVAELLGAYALDAVDPDEAAAIEDHLRDCPRCRAEVEEHRETAAFLAHAGTDAPAELWTRIAGAIEPSDVVVPLAPRIEQRPRSGTWTRWVTPLVGAAAAAVIAVLGLQVRAQGERIDELAATSMSDVREVVDLVGDGVEVPVLLDDRGRAWLQAGTLPALEEGRTYQLWGLSGDDLVSVAVLGRDPGVVSFDADGYALLAITEEDAPGVVRSENDPVVAGELA